MSAKTVKKEERQQGPKLKLESRPRMKHEPVVKQAPEAEAESSADDLSESPNPEAPAPMFHRLPNSLRRPSRLIKQYRIRGCERKRIRKGSAKGGCWAYPLAEGQGVVLSAKPLEGEVAHVSNVVLSLHQQAYYFAAEPPE